MHNSIAFVCSVNIQKENELDVKYILEEAT